MDTTTPFARFWCRNECRYLPIYALRFLRVAGNRHEHAYALGKTQSLS